MIEYIWYSIQPIIGLVAVAPFALIVLVWLIGGVRSDRKKYPYLKPSIGIEYEPGGCSGSGDCEPVNDGTLANRAAYQQEMVAQRWSRYAETRVERSSNETAPAKTDGAIPVRNWPAPKVDIPNGIPAVDEPERVYIPAWRK